MSRGRNNLRYHVEILLHVMVFRTRIPCVCEAGRQAAPKTRANRDARHFRKQGITPVAMKNKNAIETFRFEDGKYRPRAAHFLEERSGHQRPVVDRANLIEKWKMLRHVEAALADEQRDERAAPLFAQMTKGGGSQKQIATRSDLDAEQPFHSLTLKVCVEYRQSLPMRHRPQPLAILVFIVVCCLFATRSPAPLIYRPGQGWETEGQDHVEETSKEQLDKGERFEKDNKLEEAKDAYRALVKAWPMSPNAPEGQFRFGVMLFKLYDFQFSFKEFQKCLERYPDTEHFDEILKYQYDIACLFLAGERQKVWKIPTLPSMDKTVEMFEQVIKNGPYSYVAPMAQIKIGFAREKQHQWLEAVKAYQELIRKYPKSDLADDAQFQIGYAYMMASREADYDQTATNRAITALQDYITKYPKSEKIEQAHDNILKLKLEQSRGVMAVAQYYDRQKNYEAALIYYNNVVQKFPNTDLAKRASERVDQIKKRQYEVAPPEEKSKPEQATKDKAEAPANPTL